MMLTWLQPAGRLALRRRRRAPEVDKWKWIVDLSDDERGQATLIALACSNPPEGRTCWTMQLLADELVVRRVVGSISDEAVRRTLKKRAQAVASGALVH